MGNAKISLALFLYYIIFISGLSLPVLAPSEVLFTNTTLPNTLTFSNNSADLTAPTPPPGFSTRLKFNSSVQLKPQEVYICVLELMSILSNLPWTNSLYLIMYISGPDASTELSLHPFPPRSGSRLQVRYAVLGLYKVGVTIAQGSQFYELDAALYMGDEEVGWLEFHPKDPERSSGRLLALDLGHVNKTTTVMRKMTADSGKLIDPDDRQFAITFSWDGVRVKAQDTFTAFLDGFAIAAEHPNNGIDAYIPTARSASGDTVLSTWTVGQGGNAAMTWKLLKRALIMIWDLLMVGPKGQKPRFEGLIFELEYEGKIIGAGRMLRFKEENGKSSD